MTNPETAKKLAAKLFEKGDKGFLLVVFPENGNLYELSIATNANNDTLLEVVAIVTHMLRQPKLKQEVLGEGRAQLTDE